MRHPLPFRQKIIWPDRKYYFLTNSTYLHYPYFRSFEQKQLVLGFIKRLSKNYSILVQAFSISMSHHHVMFYANQGQQVTFVKRFLKNSISREYKKQYKIPYKEFWHSTKTLVIKNENMLQGIQGYIGGNLMKHKEVNDFEELYQSPFSSFKYLVDKHGIEAAKQMVFKVIGVEESGDNSLNVLDPVFATGLKRP